MLVKYPFFSHCLDKNPILNVYPAEEFVRYNELDSYVNPQDLLLGLSTKSQDIGCNTL